MTAPYVRPPHNARFPVEYQDWTLVAVTMGCVWLLMLPCWFAGLPHTTARKLGEKLSKKLYLYVPAVIAFDVTLIGFTVFCLPDWTFEDYFVYLGKSSSYIFKHLGILAQSFLYIFLLFLCYALRDRISIVLGLENVQLFKCRFSDAFSLFGGTSTYPIEVFLWKAEELQARDLFSPNDLFAEINLGFNETVRTRVHYNAGAGTVFRETFQLNYMPNEPEDELKITLRNQDIISSSFVADVTFSADELREVLNLAEIQEYKMEPQGRVWIKVSPLEDMKEEGDGRICGIQLPCFS